MPLGPLMLDLEGLSLNNDERLLLQAPEVGGVILFARNFESQAQVSQLVSEIRDVRPELLLAVDQEGGRVQRFREGFTRLPAMQQLGDFCRVDPNKGSQLIRDTGWLMASEVLACGVDFSFAPVLDVDRDTCEVIGDRSFSDCPNEMSACAQLFIKGMHEAGMATTAKHFPGHGSVVADSHLETPYDNRSLEAIRQRDLVPFAQLSAEYDAVMPAHMVFPQVTSDSVGFSPFWLQQILRCELGFEGVIFSDDLTMKGADVVGGYTDKAHAALSAGCDMVLVCNNREAALEVLQFLRLSPELAENPASAKRLAAMSASSYPNWQQLIASERYQRVQSELHQLIKIS